MADLSKLSDAELDAQIARRRRDAVTPVSKTGSEFDRADTESGAPFGVRAGASFKMTPEGKVDYLKHHYGDKNVLLDEKGNVFFREKPGARLKLFDEKDVSLADLADFAGDVPGVVLSTIGAISGAPFAGP